MCITKKNYKICLEILKTDRKKENVLYKFIQKLCSIANNIKNLYEKFSKVIKRKKGSSRCLS